MGHMKPLLIALSGLPFSGKSTLAKLLSESLSLPAVNYDNDIYAKYRHTIPEGASAAKEFEMVETIGRMYLARRLAAGQSLIYDDLGLQKEDREHTRLLAKQCGATHILVFLDTSPEVIEERRQVNYKTNGRNHIADAKLKLDMSLLEKPQSDEPAIIVSSDTSIEQIIAAVELASKTAR